MSPRRILQRQVERARALGYSVMMASELEFFLFRSRLDEAAAKGYDDLTPHSNVVIEDYHILQTTRDEYLIRDIRNGMDGAGVPVEFSKGEAGKGQHEINLEYADAVTMADRHVIYKNGAKEIARQHGRAITFMAKYSMDEVGSSCHVHSSVWDADATRSLMWSDDATITTSRPCSAAGSAGSIADRPRARVDVRPDRQLVQALPTRVVGADRARVGPRQPHVRLPRRRARRVRTGSSRASPAPTPTRTSRSRRRSPRACTASSTASRPPPRFDGNAYVAPDVARVPWNIVEAIDALPTSRRSRSRRSAPTCTTIC